MSQITLRAARPRKADIQPILSELAREFTPDELAGLLGIFRWKLKWHLLDVPTCRLAFMIHSLTFHPGKPVTIIELLTLGRHGKTPQGNLRQIKQFSPIQPLSEKSPVSGCNAEL